MSSCFPGTVSTLARTDSELTVYFDKLALEDIEWAADSPGSPV
jgi:hypothetical protein